MRDVFFLYFVVCVCFLGCSQPKVETQLDSPLKIEAETILIRSGSAFTQKLKTESVQISNGEFNFRTVGQMIALGNSSGSLSGAEVSWTELDPSVTKSVGLHLPSSPRAFVGTSFGIALIPRDYANQIKSGNTIEVSRYGMKQTKIRAQIAIVNSPRENNEDLQIVFKISGASDWYPGLNCELTFPQLKAGTVRVPQISILHEGAREYVFKALQPNQFQPVVVSVVSEDAKSAEVLNLNPGDKIVTDGAILLKPEIHFLLKDERSLVHAP